MNWPTRIAENREVAGLHFPADSAAGKQLGGHLAAALVAAKDAQVDPNHPEHGHCLAWLWQQAAAEWGA